MSIKTIAFSALLLSLSGIGGQARAAAPPNLASAVESTWESAELGALSVENGEITVEQGSRISLRVAGNRPMHLAVLLQNPAGQVRVMVPRRQDSGDQIVPGMSLTIPEVGAGEVLYADMATGRGAVYLVGTENPVFAGSPWVKGDPSPWIDPTQVATRLRDQNAGRRVITRVSLFVRSPSVKEFVSEKEFVEFYTVGTRSVKNVDRGFRIGFGLNSADLDPFSRRQLEAVGKGMKDQALAMSRFMIEGHTDDQGAPDYNKDLSVRRADAVRTFLARSMGVPVARLQVQGLGMSQPLVQGSTEEARSKNRRVVIRRVDGETAAH